MQSLPVNRPGSWGGGCAIRSFAHEETSGLPRSPRRAAVNRGGCGNERILGRMDMRKWSVAAALGVLMALPLIAQQKDEGAKAAGDTASSAAEASATPEGYVGSSSRAGVFAVPAVPRATPFPGPQAASTK